MTKHGHAGRGHRSPTYMSWKAMISRCYYPSTRSFYAYGGRGIEVVNRWRGKDGFRNFLKDMGERPEGLTLDRVRVNGNYSKSNCRWATREVQQANRRDSLRLKHDPILSIDF